MFTLLEHLGCCSDLRGLAPEQDVRARWLAWDFEFWFARWAVLLLDKLAY